MNNLIDIEKLSHEYLQLALKYNEAGLLPIINSKSSSLISSHQYDRLNKLIIKTEDHKPQVDMFPMHLETRLGRHTTLYVVNDDSDLLKGIDVLIQLLPLYIEKNQDCYCSGDDEESISTIKYKDSKYEVKTRDVNILEFITYQIREYFCVLNQRSQVLARSANYQGSKTVLTPAICAVIESVTTKDTVIVDLMCGAGSVSGSLSHYRDIIASDAQAFSRNLAKVQGGGMDVATAKSILNKLLQSFRSHFGLLEEEMHLDLKKENEFLSTEISDSFYIDFSNWVHGYDRVGNEGSNPTSLMERIESRKEHNYEKPGFLFTRYYANLFFGVLQSVEIDSLRMAISELEDPLHRQWALGALTATVSYCAYNYAGHFAQPKMNLTTIENVKKQVKGIVKKRSISVHHEFSARLLSLAEESEKAVHVVQDIEGPWEKALLKIDDSVGARDVLVYLDPPYTRDEFSRYYHVLETLTLYNYPAVSGKASVPLKGSKGRFRSSFFTRNILDIENLLVEMILACLNRKWSCLWSYSSSGIADIANVLRRIDGYASKVEIFSSDYVYSPQGKQKAKQVVEYLILILPC